jgi:Domain of unknown function (DUF4331)
MKIRIALIAGSVSMVAMASSHREGPLITEMPKCDATDFYMFNSYETGREGYVTIIANYQPFQTSYGGPNFFSMDPDALYSIRLDNDGDGKEDLSFNFRFKVEPRNLSLNIGGKDVPVALYNIGAIGPGANQNGNLNVLETYTVDLIEGDGSKKTELKTTANVRDIPKPADFVGEKSQADYEAYALNHVFELDLPGTTQNARVFVGQRKDPFVVNLGEAFDLINLNPLGPVDGKKDSLADNNCTSIIMEVPASFIQGKNDTVVGGWTAASLPRFRVLRFVPTFKKPTIETGEWVQVSRLGMPLVNELVIGIPDKNKFNASRPRNDAQFATYVTNPTLPAIIESLFGVKAPCLPRNDLVSVFLTGIDGLNKPANVKASEMLRLNLNIDPTKGGIPAKPAAQQDPLGALAGDNAGFPNGRRPGDDVVDSALRVVMGALLPDAGQPNGCAPGGQLALTDGAFVNASNYKSVFPYLQTPISSSPQK